MNKMLLILLLAACDDVASPPDATSDLSMIVDAAVGEAPPPHTDSGCTIETFAGFLGISPEERHVSCACGCTIDHFSSQAISDFWGMVLSPGAAFDPTLNGLNVVLDPTVDGGVGTDGGVTVAGLNSRVLTGPFFIDGDFDLLVDYALYAPLPLDAHVQFYVQANPAGPVGTFSIERGRTSAGANVYSTTLGSSAPVPQASLQQAGTLEIVRTGSTVQAIADGQLLSQRVGAATTRLTLILTGGMTGCGGGVDGGARCRAAFAWKNLRALKGTLVDRQ